jgi:hypothetical protein
VLALLPHTVRIEPNQRGGLNKALYRLIADPSLFC